MPALFPFNENVSPSPWWAYEHHCQGFGSRTWRVPRVGEVRACPVLVPVSTDPHHHYATASQRGPGRDRGRWQHGGQGALEGTREKAQEDTQKEIFIRGGTPLRWLQLWGGQQRSRDTPEGPWLWRTKANRERTSRKEQGKKKSKKAGAAARSHHALTQPPAPPITSPKG